MDFSRTYLPEADFEFALFGDTHYMVDGADEVEFDSRRRQSARTRYVLEQVDALDPDFAIHLGDVVQEFPGSVDFEPAVEKANEQLERLDCDLYHVAGNHDVGDKPDPTMPTEWVTAGSLQSYHERYGPSWYSWDHGGVHFVVLNSQIMNSSLDAAAEQREWLEEDLRRTADEPVFVFLHLPPFLHDPDEPSLGHYDNIDQPARNWLLELANEYRVTHLFAGHSHFRFHNRVGDVQHHVAASPSFTRPGFGELFSSCPPPERGRDDRDKLGFFLIRVDDGEPSIHFIRTAGETAEELPDDRSKLLTRPSDRLSGSRLGVSLIHPLTETTEVPETFPSTIRQRVHNDYPLLGCIELGIGFVRTPLRDQDSDLNRRKLRSLRRRGMTVVGTTLSSDVLESPAVEVAGRGNLDEIELRVADGPWPTSDTIEQLAAYQETGDRSLGLSTVVPGRTVAGKQHSRLRSGYLRSELTELNSRLAKHDCSVDRVLCRVSGDEDPWTAMCTDFDADVIPRIGSVDWLVASTDVEADRATDRFGRAMLASASQPGSRLYLEPLRSLDRTMDTPAGLLDRRCNPIPAFTAVRCLNTALSVGEPLWDRYPTQERSNGSLLGLQSSDVVLWLALPTDNDTSFAVELSQEQLPSDRCKARVVSVEAGTCRSLDRTGSVADTDPIRVDEPTMFVFES